MSSLEIIIGDRHAYTVSETNWRGEAVPRQESTGLWLHLPFDIKGCEPGQEFTVTTTALVKAPKQGLPTDNRMAEELVMGAAAIQLSKDLTSRHIWKTFGAEELLLDPITPENRGQESPSGVHRLSIVAHPNLYTLLQRDAQYLAETTETYTKAKERLWELATYHQRYDIPAFEREIRGLLNFVEMCNQRSADGWMSSWYIEKTSKVRDAFRDLFQRKNTNHPNYIRAAERASDALYSFAAPYAYRSTPPSSQQMAEWVK